MTWFHVDVNKIPSRQYHCYYYIQHVAYRPTLSMLNKKVMQFCLVKTVWLLKGLNKNKVIKDKIVYVTYVVD